MIRFGTAGAPSMCKTSEEGVQKVRELGLSAMEVEFVRGVRMSKETAAQVGAAAKELDVSLSVHAPYYINLNSKEPEKIEASRKRILNSLEIGHHLGATVIVFHAGFYGDDPEKAREKIKSEIQKCADIRQESGWDPLLGPELMGKVSSWGTIEELADVSKIAGVLPVMDFAHYHARHNGCLKSEEDFEKLLAEFEKIGSEFMHAHFSGINYSEKGERNHLPIDDEQPDYSLLRTPIKKRKYPITLICESPILERDALRLKEILA